MNFRKRPPPKEGDCALAQGPGVAIRRQRSLLVLICAVAGTAVIAVGLVTFWVLTRPPITAPQRIADEFVCWLKLGEETSTSDDDPRIGYMRAYALLSPALREQLSFESFYQEMLIRTQEHGIILDSSQRGGRLVCHYRLLMGNQDETRDRMSAFLLRVSLERAQRRWWIADYVISLADPVKAQ